MAPPGTYSVTLSRRVEGVVTDLSGPVSFEVRPLRDGSLEGADPADAAAFWARVEATQRSASAARMALSEHRNRLEAMVVALGRSTADPGDLDTDLEALRQELLDLDLQLNGHRSMRQVGEPRVPSIADRVGRTRSGVRSSTYGPTPKPGAQSRDRRGPASGRGRAAEPDRPGHSAVPGEPAAAGRRSLEPRPTDPLTWGNIVAAPWIDAIPGCGHSARRFFFSDDWLRHARSGGKQKGVPCSSAHLCRRGGRLPWDSGGCHGRRDPGHRNQET
jgi:hypothetical protein